MGGAESQNILCGGEGCQGEGRMENGKWRMDNCCTLGCFDRYLNGVLRNRIRVCGWVRKPSSDVVALRPVCPAGFEVRGFGCIIASRNARFITLMATEFTERLKAAFDNATMAEIARRLDVPHAKIRNYFQGRMPAP